MEDELQIGLTGRTEMVVTEKDLATSYGVGEVTVFSTPVMVILMEKAAIAALADLLPKGFSTVGTGLSIKHLKSTPCGMKVTAVAKLVAVDRRALEFQVEAYDEIEKIGEGTHQRFMVETNRFVEKCEQKRNLKK